MDRSIFYKAKVNDVKKIDRIIKHFDREIYNPLKLDFPFDRKWLKLPGQYSHDNFEEYLKEAYHDWAKSCLMVYGLIPSRFKGIIFDLDPEMDRQRALQPPAGGDASAPRARGARALRA